MANSENKGKIDRIAISCWFAIICNVFVVSQTEAEANSAKTMKVSLTPRVNKSIHKVGLCLDPSDRVTLLGGGPYLLVNRPLDIYLEIFRGEGPSGPASSISFTEVKHGCVRSETGWATFQMNDPKKQLTPPSFGRDVKLGILCLDAACIVSQN